VIGGELFPHNCQLIRKLIFQNKINVYNIYGITELSCWSTLYHLNEHDFGDESIESVPIGLPLSQTKLYLKQSTQDTYSDVQDLLLDNSTNKYEGVLYHSSETRICYINGQKVDFINSGDYATVGKKKVYLNGRVDDQIKINGKLTSLRLLENVSRVFIQRKQLLIITL
jgi:acyl-CoA synthetase